MRILKGNDVILKTGTGANTQGGGTTMALMKSCEIELKCDTIEVVPTSNNRFHRYIPGRMSWEITSNHLVVQMNGSDAMLMVGTGFVIQFRNRDNSRDAMYGNAICTECKIVATRGNLVTGSFRFQGTGPLTSLSY